MDKAKTLTRDSAKKLGWTIQTRNLGPSDWRHYGAWIYFENENKSRHFVMSDNATWDRPDAINAALEWIEQQSTKTNPNG